MTVPVPLNHPARPPRLTYLSVAAAVLSVAVLVAPFPLASALPGGGYRDIGSLREAVASGFVRFWSAGQDDLGADLARAADFWARFHVVKAALAAGLLLVLVANLQGAIAPLSSVLGVLPLAAPRGHLAGAVHEVRHSLATPGRAPARDLLVHDFAVYHVAMGALGGVVTVGLLVEAVVLWRRRAGVPAGVPGPDRRRRRVLAHPAPALLGFFEGGM